jgi:hypothetical protein
MGTSSWPATTVDVEIADQAQRDDMASNSLDAQIPDRPGRPVADELGGFLLVRSRTAQLGIFARSSAGRQRWITRRPMSRTSRYLWLALSSRPLAAGAPSNGPTPDAWLAANRRSTGPEKRN